MFRISQVIAKASTVFHDIATALETAVASVIQHSPAPLAAMIEADISTAKQMLSDAITYADTALASHQQAIAMAVEQAADTELALITSGASVPFNKFTNDGIDKMVAAAVSAAHVWGLSAKSRLAAANPAPPAV